MNKILTYVKSGSGIGAKYLLIYALVVTVIFGVTFNFMAKAAIPTLQKAADQLLPIKIADGVIVEPADTVKSIDLGLKEAVFPFILDTTVDSIDTAGLKDGVYIARKALYVVGKRQTKVYRYDTDMTLSRGDYKDFFKKIIAWTTWILAIFAFIFLYVMYLALTSFYALFAHIFAKMFKAPLDYCGSMRLSALIYILASVVFNLLQFSGLQTSLKVMFVSILVLQVLIIRSLTSGQKTIERTHKI